MSVKGIVGKTLLFATGVGIGYGVGYFLTKRKYEKLINSEIESVKEAYGRLMMQNAYATPEEAYEALVEPDEENPAEQESQVVEIIEEGGYFSHTPDEDTIPVKSHLDEVKESVVRRGKTAIVEREMAIQEEKPSPQNLWEKVNRPSPKGAATPDVDEDEDALPEPDPDHPYVVAEEDWSNSSPYDDNKVTLTYFEGDDTLIDERDTLVNNQEEVVGEANLLKFGLGTSDPNAVYVRNDKLEMDIEIIKDPRTYQEVVLNVKEPKLKQKPLRMRDDGD